MKNQIFTSLFVPIAIGILFSPDTSGLFTQANAQCVANWTSTTSMCTVYFTNTSTPSIQILGWTFGDGQTSYEKNPIHTYSVSGTYNVCLGINYGACLDTLCKNVTVQCGTNGIASSPQIDLSLSVTNPVFSSADIHYSIPSGDWMELVLFDIVGNKINVLETGNKSAGMYSYSLSTDAFSKGIYFIRLHFEGAIITKKIIIAE